MSGSRVRLFETTLRDGTYEVNFQMTAADTAVIAAALDRAGFGFIEVCNGVGYGSDRIPKIKVPRSVSSDAERIRAARAVVKKAKLAAIMVAGPGLTPIDAVDELHAMGIEVVRFGLEPQGTADEVWAPYVERAKKHGMTVAINLMETYRVPPQEVARLCGSLARYGGDWFYIVDSAGGMLPADVATYVRAAREGGKLEIGLHSHNNLAMAMGNAMAAVEAGATLLDTTLQGIGRATGNPSTEQTLLILQRLGHEPSIDRDLVCRLGDAARSLFIARGNDPTHFISGAGQLHSRYVNPLLQTAKKRGWSERDYLYRVGTRARSIVGATAESGPIIEEAQRGLEGAPAVLDAADAAIPALRDRVLSLAAGDVTTVVDELYTRAHKHHKPSVLHLAPPSSSLFAAPLPWENDAIVGLTVAWAADRPLPALADDRGFDALWVEPGAAATVAAPALRFELPYSTLVADAVIVLARHVAGQGGIALEANAADAIAASIAVRLRELGAGETQRKDARVVVARGCDARIAETLTNGQTLIAWGPPSSISRDDVAKLRAREVRVLRPSIAAESAARALALLMTARRYASLGATGAHNLVDALIAPAPNEAVVDEIVSPTALLDAPQLGDAAKVVAQRRARSLLDGSTL